MTKWMVVLILSVLLISGCNESIDENETHIQNDQNIEDSTKEVEDIDIEVSDKNVDENEILDEVKEETYSIMNVFPQKVGFVWYYEGPNDTEKVSVIDSISQSEKNVVLTILNCREDLTGEELFENRLSQNIIEISDENIIIDESVVLSAPLVVGNSWDTNYKLKPSGDTYTATIEIVDINENEIITKVVVSSDNNAIDDSYEEIVKYEIGIGIKSEWYNIIGIDGYMRGLDLKNIYEQPKIPDKWYLTPY